MQRRVILPCVAYKQYFAALFMMFSVQKMYKIETEKAKPNKNISSNLIISMIKLIWVTHSLFQLLYPMNGSIGSDLRIPAAQCIFQDLFYNHGPAPEKCSFLHG